ncbi:MAG: hypothetical protein V3S98_02725, partial [Dehalococcoidia bacterium]
MAETRQDTLQEQTAVESDGLSAANTPTSQVTDTVAAQDQAPDAPTTLPAPKVGRRVLTVSVDGQSIRVVAFSGRTASAWTTIDLNGPGPFELPEEFAKFLGRRSKQVSDLPFYAPLVRYFERPAVRKRYLEQVVESEISGLIPFGIDEVDLRWTP